MRKRNIRFALLLKDNKPVRTLEELENFYDNEKIFQYFENGQLSRWLAQRGYDNQLNKIQELKKVDEEFLKGSLKNILIKNEVYNSVDQGNQEQQESYYNINRRASFVNRSRVEDNKNTKEDNTVNQIIKKHLKSNLGISEDEKVEKQNEEKLNNNNLIFESSSIEKSDSDEKLDKHQENTKENLKEENVYEQKLELKKNKEELLKVEEEKEQLLELKQEKTEENELVDIKEENPYEEKNKLSELKEEISTELTKKSLGNSIDFNSIGKSIMKNNIGNVKGESKLKGSKSKLNEGKSKLNLDINLDGQKSLKSVCKDINSKDDLESKPKSKLLTNILNDSSEVKKESLLKDLKDDLNEIKEEKLLDITQKNDENLNNKKLIDSKVSNNKELIDTKVSQNEIKVENDYKDFDVDKIGEFITDPKIVGMLKDYYMSNKNIQFKCKSKENLSERVKTKEINKDSNVISLNQLKTENKDSEIKTKLDNDKLLKNNTNSSISDSLKNNNYKVQLKTLEEDREKVDSFKEKKDHKHGGLFSSLFKKNSKVEENKEENHSGINVTKNIRGSVVVSSTEEFLSFMKNRAMEEENLQVKVACSNLEIEDKYKNIKYIGNSNNASIILKGNKLFNGRENQISFSNLNITSYKKINFTAQKLEGCLVNKKMVKKDISDLLQKHPNILAKIEECNCIKEENHTITEVENLSVQSFMKEIYKNENDFSEVIGTVKYEGVSIYANVNMGMIDIAFYKTEDKDYEEISHIFESMECMDIFKRDSDIGLLLKALISKEDLKELENIRNKTYSNPKEAIWDLFKENKIEDYLQYIMLMPIKIFKQGMPLNRKEQIRIIELMNIDTGIPFLYRAFSGKRNTVEKDLYNFIEEASLNRDNYNVNFKGVVVEVLDQELRESLGVTEGKSNFETFFKFKSYIHKTRVKDIKFTLDEEFRLLPLVQIEPIKLNEKTISFVPINDPKKFKSLYLKVDDIVILGLQDGMEPIIIKDEELSKNNMNSVSTIPTVCPSCGSPIVFKEIGEFGKCENENCKGNVSHKIYSDLTELGIDIIPFDIINALVKEGYINEVTDLCGFCAEDIANIITTSTKEVETALNIIKYANKAI